MIDPDLDTACRSSAADALTVITAALDEVHEPLTEFQRCAVGAILFASVRGTAYGLVHGERPSPLPVANG